MIYVSCQFETPIGRSNDSDYVRALRADVSGCDAVGNRILLGKIAADQLLIGDDSNLQPPAPKAGARSKQATRNNLRNPL